MLISYRAAQFYLIRFRMPPIKEYHEFVILSLPYTENGGTNKYIHCNFRLNADY